MFKIYELGNASKATIMRMHCKTLQLLLHYLVCCSTTTIKLLKNQLLEFHSDQWVVRLSLRNASPIDASTTTIVHDQEGRQIVLGWLVSEISDCTAKLEWLLNNSVE